VRVHKGYTTDKPLAYALANLFNRSSVIGMGDGHGHYRKVITAIGNVQSYDAYDGAPNIYNITGGQVTFT